MSNTLFNASRADSGWAGSLGALFIGSSLALALGACSGSDSGDDPIGSASDDTEPSTTTVPSRPDPGQSAPNTSGTIDEDGPDVTDLDESTAPNGSSDDPDDGAANGEAAGTTTSPIDAQQVPDTDLCAAVADWDPEWVQFEEEVLQLVNEFRAQPADCGEQGEFPAAAPLSMNPILRCSARLHSLDMFERNFFDHNTPDGVDPFERMAEAGFVGSFMGENIAQGQLTPEEVMSQWMDSDGHCENIMRAEFTVIGIGYAPGASDRQGRSNFWTQNFGTPRATRQR